MNKGKTKVVSIRDNHDDTTPITDKVKFKYVTTLKLLGVEIDNKLEKLKENFNGRKENKHEKSNRSPGTPSVRQKRHIFRKYLFHFIVCIIIIVLSYDHS